MNCPSEIKRYLDKSGEAGRWKLSVTPEKNVESVVVIPSLAEGPYLFDTLISISKNGPEELEKTAIIIVVNNRSGCSAKELGDNRFTISCLEYLHGRKEMEVDTIDQSTMLLLNEIKDSGLNISYIDASSAGREIPEKTGVGMARKIGMDLALKLFDYESPEKNIIISLDADTLVAPNYLGEIRRYFRENKSHSAVVSFRHKLPEDEEQRLAITNYEIYLRYYVEALGYAASPYAYHTVGSTMVCSAVGYVAVGGMNRKEAAEDFYFLQKLAKYAKSGSIGQIKATTIHPSARASNRVPFGTGKKVSEMLDKGDCSIPFYNPKIFAILKRFLKMISASLDKSGHDIMTEGKKIEPLLAAYLEERNFVEVWEGLKKNSRDETMLVRQFHCWFDAFKTLKCIHYLRDRNYISVECSTALKGLMEMMGDNGYNFGNEVSCNTEDSLKLLQFMRGRQQKS